jgi:hypothetical protein
MGRDLPGTVSEECGTWGVTSLEQFLESLCCDYRLMLDTLPMLCTVTVVRASEHKYCVC